MLEICSPNEISVNVKYRARNRYSVRFWPFIGNFPDRDRDRTAIALCIFRSNRETIREINF